VNERGRAVAVGERSGAGRQSMCPGHAVRDKWPQAIILPPVTFLEGPSIPSDSTPPSASSLPPHLPLSAAENPSASPLGGQLEGILVRSVAWAAAAKWSAQIATWASTIVVARLLSASDYGVMGMAAVFMGVVAMLSEMGVGASVLILRELTDEQIAQLNALAVYMGLGAFCVTLLAAAPLGVFFRNPELPNVLRVLGLTFVIGSLRSVPLAMLQRELRFKRLAMIEAVANLAAAVTAIALAILGFGYWALALSQMAMMVASALLLLRSRPHRFALPRWRSISRALTFSNRVVGGRIGWYIYSNSDFFVAGRVLGTAALGVYSFGWSLTSVALDKVAALVNSVTPAFFSAMQRDAAAQRRTLLGVTEVIALLVFPATIGAALVAPDLVPVVFGEKWLGAVPVIQLLAIYGVLRTLRPVQNNILINIGEERFLMWTSIVSALVFPVAFFAATPYGPAGIAAVWSVLYPVSMAVGYYKLFSVGIVTPRDYLRSLLPALTGTIVMIVAVIIVREWLAADLTRVLRLVVAVLVGAAAYSLTLWFGFRDRMNRFVRMARESRRKRSMQPASA
jgi:O-antigen/teichoic acid export membrane protein